MLSSPSSPLVLPGIVPLILALSELLIFLSFRLPFAWFWVRSCHLVPQLLQCPLNFSTIFSLVYRCLINLKTSLSSNNTPDQNPSLFPHWLILAYQAFSNLAQIHSTQSTSIIPECKLVSSVSLKQKLLLFCFVPSAAIFLKYCLSPLPDVNPMERTLVGQWFKIFLDIILASTQQSFVDHLLCASPCSRHRDQEVNDQSRPLVSWSLYWGAGVET